jgi:hypothetical protein
MLQTILEGQEMSVEDGWYIVEVEGKREVAELMLDTWQIAGIDYDVWSIQNIEVTVLAKIDLITMEIKRI